MESDINKYGDISTLLSQDRVIFLEEDVTKELASTICGLLIYYNAINQQDDIQLYIHTNGGDAAALASIYDVMSLIEAPVRTIGIGKIYSAGAFILAAGAKGKRCMLKNAEVMIHSLQCSYPELPMADQIDSASYYKYLSYLNKSILKILTKHTGNTLEKVNKDLQRDLYLDAKAALKYGLIDNIL